MQSTKAPDTRSALLEIKATCENPNQLLRSNSFRQELEAFKQHAIQQLDAREGMPGTPERIAFIQSMTPDLFLEILSGNFEAVGGEERAREIIEWGEGLFNFYRSSNSFSRLTRRRNRVMRAGEEDPESQSNYWRDVIKEKADRLQEIIAKTRMELRKSVDLETGTTRRGDVGVRPKMADAYVVGHHLEKLPPEYSTLSGVNLTFTSDIRTRINYETAANKRVEPFHEIDHNPLGEEALEKFNPKEWIGYPVNVGGLLILVYVHKSRGWVDMAPGLLNLFPLWDIRDIRDKKPDGIFMFGDPNASKEDMGFYQGKDDIIVGNIPGMDEYQYFGYLKKPMLTLANVKTIERGDLPLHCGCNRYTVRFNENDEPYIVASHVLADDMGYASMEAQDGKMQCVFYGTETGAFACLDGFSPEARSKSAGREIGFNEGAKVNSRVVYPVASPNHIAEGTPLDVLLYMNNYELKGPDQPKIQTARRAEEVRGILRHFKEGERVAAGTTGTDRGKVEVSFMANPFPILIKNEGKPGQEVVHQALYDRFMETLREFQGHFETLVSRGEMNIGVAYSQMMAGAYEGNSDEDLAKAGYGESEKAASIQAARDGFEMSGPRMLARDEELMILKAAREKRERLGGNVEQLHITVAKVGDSRAGKSESAMAMEEALRL